MKVLILGSGKTNYGREPTKYHCIHPDLRSLFNYVLLNPCNDIYFLDSCLEENPDFIANVVKPNWTIGINMKFDMIFDTISHLCPIITKKQTIFRYKSGFKSEIRTFYKKEFINECRKILTSGGKFYGFCPFY